MARFFSFSLLLFMVFLSACTGNYYNSSSQLHVSNIKLQEINLGTMEGLSQNSSKTLRETLSNLAKTYDFSIKESNDAIVLQGYFSLEIYDENNAILYYVFDVLNKDGQRLHRVDGRLNLVGKNNIVLKEGDYNKIGTQIFEALKKWRLNAVLAINEDH